MIYHSSKGGINMSYEEQQVEEIKTIRERNITVKLSDAD